eukprot:GEMP01047638.1.p1 GENE.GEMP01047638.1~~GEMP01047638.1.p1  ORF type:complete len:290 (+),score=41.58 GEMP01047638.1:76-870(+)
MPTYAFKAVMANGHTIRKILETIKEFMRECSVLCTPEGIRIDGMDNSHVALLQLKWNKEAFKAYHCVDDVQLGIHFETFLKVVKLVDTDRQITLLKEADKDILRVQFGEEKDNSFFEIKLLDLEYDPLEIVDPDEESCTSFILNSTIFTNMVSEFASFGDNVRWHISDKGIKWTVQGESGTGGRFVKNLSSPAGMQKFKLSLKEDIEEEFNLKYLQIFVKASGLSEEIHFKCMPGDPMTVTFPIGSLALGRMSFFLAPKVANEN